MIQQVSRRHFSVKKKPPAGSKSPGNGTIKADLVGTGNRVSTRGSPLADQRRAIGSRIKVLTSSRQRNRGPRRIRSNSSGGSCSRNGCEVNRSFRQTTADDRRGHYRPLLEHPAAPSSQQRSAAESLPTGVLGLQVKQVPLIEAGKRALRMQVKPVLRDGRRRRRALCGTRRGQAPARALSGTRTRPTGGCRSLVTAGDVALAAQERVIIDRFRKRIKQRRREAAAQPAPQLQLRRLPCGIPARRLIDKTRWTAGTRIDCSDGISIGQELLHSSRPFDPQVGCGELQRSR